VRGNFVLEAEKQLLSLRDKESAFISSMTILGWRYLKMASSLDFFQALVGRIMTRMNLPPKDLLSPSLDLGHKSSSFTSRGQLESLMMLFVALPIHTMELVDDGAIDSTTIASTSFDPATIDKINMVT
jgi:hypothetical protein